jgi:hypothetical protein
MCKDGVSLIKAQETFVLCCNFVIEGIAASCYGRKRSKNVKQYDRGTGG